MGIFNKVFNKSNSSSPQDIPPPPTEMEVPPLPPEKGMDLPDLSPEPTVQAPSPEPTPPVQTPQLSTAEENRKVEEYEKTEIEPTEQRFPLGTQTAMPSQKASEVIGKTEEGPLFVKVDEFRRFIDSQNRVKTNIKEADNIITRLNEIKIEEDKQFEKWRTNLEDINKKIGVIDSKVFESKR